MSESLGPDVLWEAIELVLPEQPPQPQGGRTRISDRAALGGNVFVLRTGCPWRLLPKELGCGSGTTYSQRDAWVSREYAVSPRPAPWPGGSPSRPLAPAIAR